MLPILYIDTQGYVQENCESECKVCVGNVECSTILIVTRMVLIIVKNNFGYVTSGMNLKFF